jgi:hypothetical protein
MGSAKIAPCGYGSPRARGRRVVSGSRQPAWGTTRECLRSRGANASELCKIFSAFPEKGRGECRALDAPAVSRAKWGREHTRSSPWVHRSNPAFPHAVVLTVSFVISPVIGLCCHRRLARLSAELDASVEASGPHDFAVRVQPRSSAVLTSVHRIPSRVRDDRERPLVGRDGAIRKVFCVEHKSIYFCDWHWTGDLPVRHRALWRGPCAHVRH